MNNTRNNRNIVETYRQRAAWYDFKVKLFDVFAFFGFNISGWRKKAISALNLKPGDTVVDIGCGTGLNFPLLYQAVTSTGKIIAVDISEAMLNQARRTIATNEWTNFQLVCSDAAKFTFPSEVNAVVSAYTLILVPDCKQVISNAYKSLSLGGRLVILDMAWPHFFPLWFRHVLFFLSSYGVTLDVLRHRSWKAVQLSMKELFPDYAQKKYWFGFFYMASGTA